METSLGGTQFGENLQAVTIACEHPLDEDTSPEDRLGENNLTPAWGIGGKFKSCKISEKIIQSTASTGKSEEIERIPIK